MKKKATILTGFLGSGKTTYLNHLIKSNPNTKFAIIENEFGEQSIDGELIIKTSEDIVELTSGCLCCSLNENLYDILSDLHLRKNEFDELIIEATGIADPASIAEPFLTHPAVKNNYELVHTICIIDAEQIEDWLEKTEEARMQITFADVLLINKTDLIEPTYAHQLIDILKGINPLAQIVIKENGVYPTIVTSGVFEKLNTIEDKNICYHIHPEKINAHENNSTISHQHSDITTHSFVFSEAFNIDMLYHQLFVLLTLQSKYLYRFKAIVFSENFDKKIVIQSVGKRLSMEEIKLTDADKSRQSKFVFIGKNIKPEGFRKLVERCIIKKQEEVSF